MPTPFQIWYPQPLVQKSAKFQNVMITITARIHVCQDVLHTIMMLFMKNTMRDMIGKRM